MPFEKFSQVVAALGIYYNHDRSLITRSNYTSFDLLSDIGGLSSVIASTIVFVLSVINIDKFDNRMVEQLFSFPKQQKGSNNSIAECFPLLNTCCSKNQRARELKKAQQKL